MKSLLIFIATLVLFIPTLSRAQIGTIQTIDGVTKAKKQYSVGVDYFDIDVSNISGWNKCTAQPLKVFQFEGLLRMRIDLTCSTKSGQLVNFNCSTGKGGYELSVPQIQATGSRLLHNNQINSNGYMDITLTCDYLR